ASAGSLPYSGWGRCRMKSRRGTSNYSCAKSRRNSATDPQAARNRLPEIRLCWIDALRLLRSRRLAASRRATARCARAQDKAIFFAPSETLPHPEEQAQAASQSTHIAVGGVLHWGRGELRTRNR